MARLEIESEVTGNVWKIEARLDPEGREDVRNPARGSMPAMC